MCWSMNEHINSSPVQRLQYTLLPLPRIPISPHLHITCSAALGIFQKVIFSQAFYNHSFSNWSCPQTLLDCLCACVHAKSLQSYPTLCNLVVCSLPGTSVHGILQARTLQWVAMSFSRGSSHPGIKPVSLMSPADRFFTTSTTKAWEKVITQEYV